MAAKNFVEASVPPVYSSRVLGNLKADAMSLSLGHAPWFYDIAVALAPYCDTRKMLPVLQAAMVDRYKVIVDKAQHSAELDLADFVRKLTTREKKCK